MDIIGNIKETISKTGRSAVKKTKDLAGLARINARIEETKTLRKNRTVLTDRFKPILKKRKRRKRKQHGFRLKFQFF